jgi:hypothetical protein
VRRLSAAVLGKIIDVPTTAPPSRSAATNTRQRSRAGGSLAPDAIAANERRDLSMICASASRSSGRFTESR